MSKVGIELDSFFIEFMEDKLEEFGQDIPLEEYIQYVGIVGAMMMEYPEATYYEAAEFIEQELSKDEDNSK